MRASKSLPHLTSRSRSPGARMSPCASFVRPLHGKASTLSLSLFLSGLRAAEVGRGAESSGKMCACMRPRVLRAPLSLVPAFHNRIWPHGIPTIFCCASSQRPPVTNDPRGLPQQGLVLRPPRKRLAVVPAPGAAHRCSCRTTGRPAFQGILRPARASRKAYQPRHFCVKPRSGQSVSSGHEIVSVGVRTQVRGRAPRRCGGQI